jgi:ATP-dependent DNA helicase DinG
LVGVVSINNVFAENGLLAQQITGYRPRQAQLDMATSVEEAIIQQKNLIVEAGTGTGKTFAYLAPVLLRIQSAYPPKVIISTGSKNLQDQLFNKDLPLIKAALASNAQIALLKGRANYLCLYRLALFQQSRGQLDANLLSDLVKIQTWATQTQQGDIAEVVEVAEDSDIFRQVTSTTDNCLGKDCPQFNDCYLLKARQKAIESDVVVVNHHLFFADMALKDTGFGELIPQADVVIFDEAHELTEIANQYFGEHLSTRQLLELGHDVYQQYRTELTDVKQLGLAAEKLIARCQQFRLLFAYDNERGNWQQRCQYQQIRQGFASLIDDLNFLYQVIKLCVSRTEMIDRCFDRASHLLALCELMQQTEQLDSSYWYETNAKHVVIHQTPLSIAEKFSQQMSKYPASWVFTSATLSVNQRFEHFSSQLGISNATQLLLDSPFNYEQQALLLVPRYLPDINNDTRAAALAALAAEMINASQGSCLLLFTSYRMMHWVAEHLSALVDNPLLVQGSMGKQALLHQFIAEHQAVLLATSSFWQGVDIRGNNLTCVMIDKLPFASPDDPLQQAKCTAVRQRGDDPFYQVQLPQAVIELKQGVGRLIRDVNDQGVMVICDNRLVSKPYGQIFLQSLPPMKRTRSVEAAINYLNQIHQKESEPVSE